MEQIPLQISNNRFERKTLTVGQKDLAFKKEQRRKLPHPLIIFMIILALLERGTGRCDHVMEFWGKKNLKKDLQGTVYQLFNVWHSTRQHNTAVHLGGVQGPV